MMALPKIRLRRSLALALLTGALSTAGAAPRGREDMTWWYRTPATRFWEGLPIGTGRFAAMVYGGVGEEKIPFNDETLWSGSPYDPNNPDGPRVAAAVRRLVLAGHYAQAQRLAWQLFSFPLPKKGDTAELRALRSSPAFMNANLHRVQSYQPMGRLRLEFPGQSFSRVTDYRRELNMDRAVVTVSYRFRGARYRREIFASFPDQAVVIHLTCDQPGRLSFVVVLDSVQPSARNRPARAPGQLILAGGTVENPLPPPLTKFTVPSRMRWEARVQVRTQGGSIAPISVPASGGRRLDALRVTQANAATLILVGATNFVRWNNISADPARRCEAYLAGANRPYAQLLARHLADYQPQFRACTLDLGRTPVADLDTTARLRNLRRRFKPGPDDGTNRDPSAERAGTMADPLFVAQYFQYGRYLLLAGSRPGTLAFNNHNIWLDGFDSRWRGRWTLNINLEECYWPAEETNLPGTTAAFLNFMQQLSEAGARTARELYGCRGWVAHHGTDIWMNTAPTDSPRYGMSPICGAWLCHTLWEHYRFDPRRAYLARIYPILKGSAQFFLDFMVRDPSTGELLTCISQSPENAFRTPDGHVATLDKCPALDAEVLHWLFSACILAAERLGVDAPLRRQWAEARAHLPPPKIGSWGRLQEWYEDWDETEPQHRHLSHLWLAYPGNELRPRLMPDLTLAVEKSLDQRGDEKRGWSGAWKINLWARLGQPERAYRILMKMVTDVSLHPFPDDSDRVPSMEGNQGIQGVTAGIAEMLLQSYAGFIELLPALPREWPIGRVTGLRARGGFTVDIAWRGGWLTEARIFSRAGGHCLVRYAGRTIEVSLRPGETRLLTPAMMKVDHLRLADPGVDWQRQRRDPRR